MKITKILVALSFLFAVSTAHAGEMTVTGSMKATYQSEQDDTSGNPLGMDREIAFTGTTELDNGMSMTVMQDFDDAGNFGNAKLTFGGVAGLVNIYVGTDGSEVDAIDDITPSAFEEANGAGSGTYQDVGGLANEMGIGFNGLSVPLLGTVSGQYVPKADAAENEDGVASRDANAGVGSGMEIVIRNNLGDLPFLGSFLDGNSLTVGYAEEEINTAANTTDRYEATVALTGSYGNFSYGYQKKHIDAGQVTDGTTDALFYGQDIIGIAYAVNDALSVSYNIIEESKHDTTDADIGTYKQETDAINIGYTIGGLTLGFQEASTDNAGQVVNTKDDTRRIQVKANF
jgi:hypothetical protein